MNRPCDYGSECPYLAECPDCDQCEDHCLCGQQCECCGAMPDRLCDCYIDVVDGNDPASGPWSEKVCTEHRRRV